VSSFAALPTGSYIAELHVLVNNSGANWGAPYSEYPDEAFTKVMAVGLFSCLEIL
jgi:NAD(P)-dependent dehydrogenase (short-subunit alcohol dehydrogenase family)